MWFKWLPWHFVIRKIALSRGFVDPMGVLAKVNKFAQPAENMAPVELLRAGAVLHARGLLNNQVIHHNLDWVWPFWVERQFDPRSETFVPRAFAMTHINLVHRNWTAVGLPYREETPIVDPRGLVMPFFDSWSVDAWILTADKKYLVPSRLPEAQQNLEMNGNLKVVTESALENNSANLMQSTEMVDRDGKAVIRMSLKGKSSNGGWLILSIRPYNPEGISLVHDIEFDPSSRIFKINHDEMENGGTIEMNTRPDSWLFSKYQNGDVFGQLKELKDLPVNPPQIVSCQSGMATGAAIYSLEPNQGREVEFEIPLYHPKGILTDLSSRDTSNKGAEKSWETILTNHAKLQTNESQYNFLWESAIRTLVLHTTKDVYAGPYTYKRFWYRDAAFIIHALMSAGFLQRAENLLDLCVQRQSINGFFKSQEGEWDSNGQVLWCLGRFCELSGKAPKPQWIDSIRKAVAWIAKKRVMYMAGIPHSGLLPAGFSAEHLGPNDYFYWDDFWSIAGLYQASSMLEKAGYEKAARRALLEAQSLKASTEKSLETVYRKNNNRAMPASPYRRMDSAAIGSIAASYPLQIWPSDDERISETADYLYKECLVNGALYHDISHSGINPYLTLHLAQTFLRNRDSRFGELTKSIAKLASPTGNWPEAIHPRTSTGCMGDGQHVWAASEWIQMMRNCFVMEELDGNKLLICNGVEDSQWNHPEGFSFGPAPTSYGFISIKAVKMENRVRLQIDAKWTKKPSSIEVRGPWGRIEKIGSDANEVEFELTKEG